MASPTDLKQGTVVQILSTENVVQRFPELVGKFATIDKVPVYPSTWFTVRILQQPARTVKMQPTALKLAPNSPSMNSNEENVPVKNRPGRPRSNSIDSNSNDKRPRSNSATADGASHVHSLILGAEVVIRATESVLQRTPHLAGQIGYVKEVPVHPATWFKVRLADNTVHTFRPSALRLSSQPEEEMIENSPYRPLPSTRNKTGSARSTHTSSAPVPPALSLPPPAHSEDVFKPGVNVRIISGRLRGQLATVVRVTNGWIQVETSTGELAKRAADLEVCNNLSGFEGNVGIMEAKRGRGRPARPSKPNRYYSGDIEAPIVTYKRLAVPTASTMENFKEKYNHPHNAADNSEYESSIDNDDQNCNMDDDYDTHGKSSCVSPCEEDDEHEISETWKSLDIPFADPTRRQKKRKCFQGYVDFQYEVVMSRPDFKYWLSEIKGCTVDGFGNEKPSGDICPVCATEKWVGGKMCWNETCSTSPIYLFRGQQTPVVSMVAVTAPVVTAANSHHNAVASAPIESCSKIIKSFSHEEEIPSISHVYSNDSTTTTQSHVTFCGCDEDEHLPAGFKRPREDSIATTDVEGVTPERSWSSEELAMKGLCSATPLTLPPNGIGIAATVM